MCRFGTNPLLYDTNPVNVHSVYFLYTPSLSPRYKACLRILNNYQNNYQNNYPNSAK